MRASGSNVDYTIENSILREYLSSKNCRLSAHVKTKQVRTSCRNPTTFVITRPPIRNTHLIRIPHSSPHGRKCLSTLKTFPRYCFSELFHLNFVSPWRLSYPQSLNGYTESSVSNPSMIQEKTPGSSSFPDVAVC